MIFIAAGMGSRLLPVSKGIPKTLMKVMDRPLIDILCQNCLDVGIKNIIIVTGYKNHLINNHFSETINGMKIKLLFNVNWKLPNGLSVLIAEKFIPRGENFLLSMSDHIYFPGLLKIVKESNLDETIVNVGIDYNIEKIYDLDDAMKVKVDNNSLVKSISKDLSDYNAVDCGVFKCRYEFFSILNFAREKASYSLSDGCKLLLKNEKLGGVDVGNNFWLDIDTPDSLEYFNKNHQLQNLI
tara:strand:+ start:29650 stop:30369 length:720 start_codon:yes stop_codon:yes gene_type:complete